MDSAVIPLSRNKGLSLVQTVDFFYPLIDHPKIMGKIALANVVSDIYSVGVVNIDKLSLVASTPAEFTENQRDIVMSMIVEGFNEGAIEAGCKVGVTNIALNPWCIIGGVATSVCREDEIIMPCNAVPGDIVVLTKPLGTQLATNAYIWMEEKNEKFEKICEILTKSDIEESFNMAIKSMSYLNKSGAHLMHKYNAHAATDVTGFGLVGHAQNLAQFQTEEVDIIIERLPIIKNIAQIGEIVGQDKKLKSGQAVETSGGLLICLPAVNAPEFCQEYKKLNKGHQAWIVGRVVSGTGSSKLIDGVEIINVVL